MTCNMSESHRVPCRKCAEPIIFIQSKKGRAIPCDPDLVTHVLAPGVVVVTPDGQVLRGTEESKETSVLSSLGILFVICVLLVIDVIPIGRRWKDR